MCCSKSSADDGAENHAKFEPHLNKFVVILNSYFSFSRCDLLVDFLPSPAPSLIVIHGHAAKHQTSKTPFNHFSLSK